MEALVYNRYIRVFGICQCSSNRWSISSRCLHLKLMLQKSRLSWVGQCILIYSDLKGVLFRLELETEFKPSDESLKQGRNRSWLLYTPSPSLPHTHPPFQLLEQPRPVS